MFDYILESLQAGGWVLFPIVATSVIGWYLGLKLLLEIHAMSLHSRKLQRKVKYPTPLIQWLDDLPKKERNTMPAVVLSHLWEVRAGGEKAMLEALDEELRFFQPRLEKGLSTIGAMGAAAPLLGLLGTVSGMVGTFRTISVFGAGNPALMADSIAEALVTTQNGLLAALPLMILHNFLYNRSVKLEKDTLKSAQRLINHIVHRNMNARLRL